MNIREKIIAEQEKNAPFGKQEFLDAVSWGLIDNGEFAFTIDARTEKGYSLSSGPYIPAKFLPLIKAWTTEAGLSCTRIISAFGVPEYIITL